MITIIYCLNSFSSLIACYLVRLDKQIFSGPVEIFFGQMAQPHFEQLARAPVSSRWCRLGWDDE